MSRWKEPGARVGGVAELDGPLAERTKGEANGEREQREELGVVVKVGSEVETLLSEEEEQEEAVLVTELRDPWLERRKVYMATANWADVVREYLAWTIGDPRIVNDTTKSMYARVGHLIGVSLWKSRESG